MLLGSVFAKTIRDQRWATLGWGLGLAVIVIVTAEAWARAYPTALDRQILAAQASSALSGVQVLYGEPRQIDQLGGFLAWRQLGLQTVMLGLFMVIAVSGATRGAEASGRLEVVAVALSSRRRLLIETLGGLVLSLVVACLFVAGALLAAGPIVGEPAITPARVLPTVLNMGLAAALFGAIALLAAQLVPSRRAAGMWAGTLLIGTYIWNNLGLVSQSLEGWRVLSPFALYSLSSPAADGHVDPRALVALAALILAIGATATWLHLRRDLFNVARPWRRGAWTADPPARSGARRAAPAARAWLFRNPFAFGVRGLFATTIAWGLGLAVFCGMMAGLAPGIRDALAAEGLSGGIIEALREAGLGTDAGVIGLLVFSFLPLISSLFAIMIASSWAGAPGDAGLDLEIATPVSRRAYATQRLLAAAVAIVLALVLALAGVVVVGVPVTREVDWGQVVLAFAVMIPVPLAVLGFGFAIAARPRLPTAGIAGGVVLASFFLDLLIPLLGLPERLRDLSVFHLYGQPLIDGVDWPRIGVLVAITAVLGAAGVWGFERRDLAD